jgi:hypothetical protein
MAKTLEECRDSDGAISIPLANGCCIRSGFCDPYDPDVQIAGDWLSVTDNHGRQLFYVESADLADMGVVKVRRALLEMVCACLGAACPETG